MNNNVSGVPDQVKECTVLNEQISSLTVSCKPGFDGGLKQKFFAQVIIALQNFKPNLFVVYIYYIIIWKIFFRLNI